MEGMAGQRTLTNLLRNTWLSRFLGMVRPKIIAVSALVPSRRVDIARSSRIGGGSSSFDEKLTVVRRERSPEALSFAVHKEMCELTL